MQQKKSNNPHSFIKSHLGINASDENKMCAFLQVESKKQLNIKAIPKNIYKKDHSFMHDYIKSTSPEGLNQSKAHDLLKTYFKDDKVHRQWIGQGYYETIVPSAIKRYFFENPGFYTPYTPYQSEIAQGRLELLFYFQTICCELTGFDLANASLLDEGTAAGEALRMSYVLRSNSQIKDYFISNKMHKQTLSVLSSRAKGLKVNLLIGCDKEFIKNPKPVFGAMISYPDTLGHMNDFSELSKVIKKQKAMLSCCSDLLALSLYKAPAQLGADIAFGSAQRLGVPIGYGGPHGAFFATSKEYRRYIPARVVAKAKDRIGNTAYRLALQTREQHIKRDRATSNICTSQALLANMSACYVIFHGKENFINIAKSLKKHTAFSSKILTDLGYILTHQYDNSDFFDTITIDLVASIANLQLNTTSKALTNNIKKAAESLLINLNYSKKNYISFCFGEGVDCKDIADLISCITLKKYDQKKLQAEFSNFNSSNQQNSLKRSNQFLNQAIFNKNFCEIDFLRWLKILENKDLSLVHAMIPLGSCTMKLNSAAQLEPVSWPIIASAHPHQPKHQSKGYELMLDELKLMLGSILGLPAVSLQPNSGAQGELAGLWVIRHYFKDHNQYHNRHICLVPKSAHGTNPASAVMAGLDIKIIKCDNQGNIDANHLKQLITEYHHQVACIMITYPSTHGVFEPAITDICDMIHQIGGFVYLDGANLNAQVGLCSPGEYGVDVCHVNLHKTFCIPHGGGGPGAGPIAVTNKLKKYLPADPANINNTFEDINNDNDNDDDKFYISSAHHGSASILTISWVYLKMIGADGLRESTESAVLSANYVAKKLDDHYPVLYKGLNNLVAHECLIDLRAITKATKITVEDVAKRLMDYGFHAPTVSFPIPGTMMIEPTESESLTEINRFVDAMISIKKEIDQIKDNIYPMDNNPIKNAPHTWWELIGDWHYPYSKQRAFCPLDWIKQRKFFPSCARIDNASSDRNFVCACDPTESYED